MKAADKGVTDGGPGREEAQDADGVGGQATRGEARARARCRGGNEGGSERHHAPSHRRQTRAGGAGGRAWRGGGGGREEQRSVRHRDARWPAASAGGEGPTRGAGEECERVQRVRGADSDSRGAAARRAGREQPRRRSAAWGGQPRRRSGVGGGGNAVPTRRVSAARDVDGDGDSGGGSATNRRRHRQRLGPAHESRSKPVGQPSRRVRWSYRPSTASHCIASCVQLSRRTDSTQIILSCRFQ